MKGKSFWTIAIIVVVCIIGWNVINDDSTNTNSGNQNSITDSGVNENDNSVGDYNTDNNDYQTDNLIPYTISKSGYLVENNLSPITYSLNDISTLSGFFVMNKNSNLISVPQTKWNGLYESTNKYLYKGSQLPVCLDRTKGDKLIVVGGEWEGRSRNEKTNMTINIFNLTLLGYGNIYMFEDLDVEDMDNVNGISISSVNRDSAQVTKALNGTGISCVYQYNNDMFLRHKYLISSQYNSPVTCGFYEGTEYKSMTVNLTHPFILPDEENPISLPVQTTPNGYFIVDVSSLPTGMYALDALMGSDIIVIE